MSLATLWFEYVVFLFFVQRILSIMSGDSPNSHQNDIFDFKDAGRTSPAPTTSKDIGVQSGEVVQASVLVEPPHKDDDGKDLNSPILNNGTSPDDRSASDPDQTVQLDDLGFGGKRRGERDDDQERRKLNGDADKLDGVWVPGHESRKAKVKAEEDDDNCTVKCLYYTMQCCECAIM